MPLIVYVMGFGIFAMTTSEFMVAGMLPELSSGLGVSISAIGYLVSAYAIAMALGGPVIAALMVRLPGRRALIVLLSAFLIGQVLGAVSFGYPMLVASRLITGGAEAAFFGVGLTVAMNAAAPGSAGRASSVVFGGLMLSSVLGAPLATYLAQLTGWRGAFWAVAGVVLMAGAAVVLVAPRPEGGKPTKTAGSGRLRAELVLFRNRDLWAVYGTSMLHIGALFAAFSYFAAIFTDVTGFAPALVPVLLTAYGVAAVIGNLVVGRLADRFPMALMSIGLGALTVLLVGFALGVRSGPVVLVAVLGLGLIGLPLNSATIARRIRVAANSPLINTVGTSMVNVGIALGPLLGGLAISAGFTLAAPLWTGAGMALLGALSLLPYLRRTLTPAPAVCVTA